MRRASRSVVGLDVAVPEMGVTGRRRQLSKDESTDRVPPRQRAGEQCGGRLDGAVDVPTIRVGPHQRCAHLARRAVFTFAVATGAERRRPRPSPGAAPRGVRPVVLASTPSI